MSSRRSLGRVLSGGAVLALCFAGPTVNAQLTDGTGMFQPQAFLAYGPFGPAVGQLPCDTTEDDLLVNFIAPEAITCFTPEEGDEPGWDGLWAPGSLIDGAYYGPLGLGGNPVVRAYGGVLTSLDSEYGGDDRAQWMITYLEYTGPAAVDAEFCLETDDGVVMLLDGQIIHSHQICRAIPAACAGDIVPVTIEPGAHIITTGVFDRGGGWELRMALRVNGVPVIDGDADWIFLGTERPPAEDFPGGDYPCFEPPQIIPTIPDVSCEFNAQGGADVTWTLPPDLADFTDSIEVSLNGAILDTVSADTSSYTIDAAELAGLSLMNICAQPAGASRATCCGLFRGVEIYINCGGLEFVDAGGRLWAEDSAANPSPFLTSPAVNTAGGQTLPDLSFDPDIMDNHFPPEIFQDERWNDGPVEYTIPGFDDSKSYDVHLLFREHCCSDGCLDGDPGMDPCDAVSEDESPPSVDPQFISSTCRVFNILINDEIVRQQWSKSVYAACLSGNPPGPTAYNIGVSVLAEEVDPVDGAIKILIEDLGGGNPPENASIKGIAIIESGRVVMPSIEEVNCVRNAAGGVDVTWTLPDGLTTDIEVSLQGSVIETVSSTTSSTTIPADKLDGISVAKICVQPIDAVFPACCTLYVGGNLYINCGGAEFVDSEDRVWIEDSLENPTEFLTSPNAHTDVNQTIPDTSFDPNIVDNLIPGEIFQNERWNDGPVEYTIAGFDDSKLYDVHFFFREHCCSDGCLDSDPGADPCDGVSEDELPPLLDPELLSSTCRVFDLYVNDEIVRDQFSKNVLAACLSGNPPGATSNDIAVSVKIEEVAPVDGVMKILVDDIGAGINPPENASIKGIAIVESGTEPPPKDQFSRGDTDANGLVNITDGIFVLNFLFLGGPTPTCSDAADADDNGLLNITDGIFVLNFLFLGGPTPPAPTAPTCGVDPTEDDLDCASFPPCE